MKIQEWSSQGESLICRAEGDIVISGHRYPYVTEAVDDEGYRVVIWTADNPKEHLAAALQAISKHRTVSVAYWCAGTPTGYCGRNIIQESGKSDMAILNSGDVVMCPCCGTSQVDVVDDFVVPGCIGHESERSHDCEGCGRRFRVACVGEDQYGVAPSPEPGGLACTQ